MGSSGCLLYTLRWKRWATSSGLLIPALRASARRTSGTGCSSALFGWPTPAARDWKSESASEEFDEARWGHTRGKPLSAVATLAGWPTPQASDGTGGGQAKRAMNPERSNDLNDFAMLAGWAAPTAADGNRGSLPPRPHDTGVPLSQMAALASSGTTAEPARFTASGEMLTGSSAGMDDGGQLDPAHSRWLMGYPPAWCDCAVSAMQSFPRSRRRS
ncbi:MAG: hypothetical protein AAGI34_16260, partial [Pseudomonadota bacterium]